MVFRVSSTFNMVFWVPYCRMLMALFLTCLGLVSHCTWHVLLLSKNVLSVLSLYSFCMNFYFIKSFPFKYWLQLFSLPGILIVNIIKLRSTRTSYTVSLYLVISLCCIAERCCRDIGVFLHSFCLCFSLSAALSLLKYVWSQLVHAMITCRRLLVNCMPAHW